MQRFAKPCNRKVELVRFQYVPPLIFTVLLLIGIYCWYLFGEKVFFSYLLFSILC